MKNLGKFGHTKYDYPLATLTTFKIGGQARAVIWIEQEEKLVALIDYLQKIGCPYYLLGRGSNVLVSDAGYPGVIIKLNLKAISYQRNQHLYLKVGAGIKISHLLGLCIKHGWTGLEFMTGIPGTIGGAIAVNAGAFGHSIGKKVTQIKIFSPRSGIKWISWDESKYGYRHTKLSQDTFILGAELELSYLHPQQVSMLIKKYFCQKKATQPLFYHSAGCVFKNPTRASAGYLIDKAGLKGKRIGGAEVSEKHANFIINKYQAKAADVFALMEFVQETVEKCEGVRLEPEIRFIT
ncbi:MAG: UDP-N-acetylmuramate dehydrogenase [Candidatus Desulfofervidaceae bacterium]|nr:UDP-N-acetylmuramate dehydrogenase [Candidatus Desulfofervidaceae bacterium]